MWREASPKKKIQRRRWDGFELVIGSKRRLVVRAKSHCFSICATFVLPLAFLLMGCFAGPPRPDIILVTVDTLRADALSCLGGPEGLTPNLDTLARRGVLFQNAISQGCFTAPAMASLATGVYPLEHGVMDWGDDGGDFSGAGLPARLSKAGYRTVFLSAHGGLKEIRPLRGGFDVFRDAQGTSGRELTGLALAEIRRVREQPLFLWVHYFDPHGPYEPPEEVGRAFTDSSHVEALSGIPYEEWTQAVLSGFSFQDQGRFFTRMYQGEVRVVDTEIGRLIDAFEASCSGSAWSGAVTADHGENLTDHAPLFDHRNAVFDSLVRVPLILLGSDLSPDVVPGVVETRGLPKVLLEAAGVPVSTDEVGLGSRGVAFTDSGFQDDPHKGMRTAEYKITFRLKDSSYRLYDLGKDAGEQVNVGMTEKEILASYQNQLDQWVRSFPPRSLRGRIEELSPETRRRLEDLGYLGKTRPSGGN